jgi:hypothetical protein
MNASQFMDKQILGLAASAAPSTGGSGSVDLSDLMIPVPQQDGEDRLRRRRSFGGANGTADDVMPSYDFQPIRTTPAAAPQASWGPIDSKAPSVSASASYNLKVWLRVLLSICLISRFGTGSAPCPCLHNRTHIQLC